MSTQLELLEEAYNRGILPPEKKALYEEAASRGLIGAKPDGGKFVSGPIRKPVPGVDQPELGAADDKPWARAASQFYTPMLEGGGMVAGGIAGTGASPIAGTIAGGAIGYGIGSQGAHALDVFLGVAEPETVGEELVGGAKRLKEGAMYEMGGGIAARGIVGTGKGVWALAEKLGLSSFFQRIKKHFPGISDKGILQKAKQTLKEVRSEEAGAIGKETEELLKRGGIKTAPTYAQKTGSRKAGSFEQAASAKDADLKAHLLQQDAQINQEALAYVEKQFPKGASIDDVVKGVGGQQAQLEAKAARTAIEAEGTVGLGATPQAVGMEIRPALQEAKAAGKETVKELYKKIPKDIELSPTPLVGAIAKIGQNYKKIGGGSKTNPTAILKQIKQGLKEGIPAKVTFDQLRDWRSQVSQELRDIYRSADPNLKLARRYKMLEEGIDNTMDQLLGMGGKHPEAAKAYREASKYFAKEYVPAYRAGTVADVLQSGRQAYGGKLTHSEIPARFFEKGKLDAADDLVRSVGQKKAGNLIKDYATQDLLSKAKLPTGELGAAKAQTWLKQNKTVLEKYNLYKHFKDVVRKKQVAEAAVKELDAFNKTAASVVLKTDVDKVVGKIFTGQGKAASGDTMVKVLNLPGIKGNKAAIDGLKVSFKDHLLKQMENSGVDVLGNPLRSIAKGKKVLDDLKPAIYALYKDSPKQAQALFDYHKFLGMLARNKNVTYAGGSTTTEKMTGSWVSAPVSNAIQFFAVMKQRGWIYSTARNLAVSVFRAPLKHSAEQTEKLLHEAIYNPAVAKTIMDAAAKPNSKIVQKELNAHLMALGVYAGAKGAQATRDELEGL